MAHHTRAVAEELGFLILIDDQLFLTKLENGSCSQNHNLILQTSIGSSAQLSTASCCDSKLHHLSFGISRLLHPTYSALLDCQPAFEEKITRSAIADSFL